MTDLWNRALRSAFAPAREVEPTDAEVQRVLALDAERSKRPARRPVLRPALTACATLVMASGAYAVPATRAALDDVYGTISGWVSDDERSGPGRALTATDDAPAWIRESDGDKRLVAENGGASLFAVHSNAGQISFALAGSVGLSDSVEGWRRQLEGKRVVLLGLGAFPSGPLNDHDQRPLFGLATRSVERVELRYTTGQPTSADHLDGGFVLLADARRQPQTLVAFGHDGNEIARIDATHLTLRVCHDTSGCPPGQLDPPPSAG
jgi:hypothetical protein